MAIFKLTERSTGRAMVVRAKCLSCARAVAVENAGPEGTRVWRDSALSTVELIRENDKTGLILKSE
ncbi:aldehyde dehydrogenase [Bordetella genomosp. 4]|uniref:Aldehyde dehydrogenase n=1 Tax=Bordetella genomosp. 4 TaxID=463044 RepID=A0A261U6X6_9BORD|nr:aldehyde dehydrogenase [Bordetella genomosp. 4]